ncbi:aspartate-semialdehyde dehydrogenase [Clostridioides difficile DA00154]|uniref:aspartate-semialdehyde dehydrogenase n=1 Tax=Clostridioides difficile TaxID=1496 RepID=UPI00038C837F|nr:aspartate-semialdehyde dehydrogenase [Clostridioides difficile]EQG64128.1 aspartate-semialdehyde dehydrogenase [Clostridioides difficile DA00154]
MKKVNVAIVGATGMVGRTFLKVLEERNFPIENLFLFSSSKSAGSKVMFCGKEYIVEELKETSFTDRGIQIALFSAGGSISEKYAPIAASNGILVVDNSSQWRMNPDVPLVVPEVNPEAIKNHKGIIANPNCSTIQAMVPLKALDDKYKIKRVVYSTYQAVSGSGVKGVEDLEKGMNGNPTVFYPHQISYNCLPHIDSFTENGYTKEEMKMVNETMKILDNYDLKITATTVRVPVKNGHSESINVEFNNSFELDDLVKTLEEAPGVVVVDNPAKNEYPTAVEFDDRDEVFVGRIRRDFSVDNGVNLWVVADNIRKGAATNAIQIAEMALSYDLV